MEKKLTTTLEEINRLGELIKNTSKAPSKEAIDLLIEKSEDWFKTYDEVTSEEQELLHQKKTELEESIHFLHSNRKSLRNLKAKNSRVYNYFFSIALGLSFLVSSVLTTLISSDINFTYLGYISGLILSSSGLYSLILKSRFNKEITELSQKNQSLIDESNNLRDEILDATEKLSEMSNKRVKLYEDLLDIKVLREQL
ncbi:V-type ATPase 116kDa subunit family protein [Paraferrimonas sp. SM1919]|uniref:V-type ATPase 116kDa subunit family protein n=1 Tax=Paraferrimonas sp. SM1919 TaxID=2662263 RepID=UPI0013D36FFA|nr:V-type ATPase 116kDa subunit family protein [Paraferrimonas sp. SM1919]